MKEEKVVILEAVEITENREKTFQPKRLVRQAEVRIGEDKR